jgi:hypothetical protein
MPTNRTALLRRRRRISDTAGMLALAGIFVTWALAPRWQAVAALVVTGLCVYTCNLFDDDTPGS